MPITVDELKPEERAVYDTLNEGQKQIYLDLSAPVRRIVGRWAPTDAWRTFRLDRRLVECLETAAGLQPHGYRR